MRSSVRYGDPEVDSIQSFSVKIDSAAGYVVKFVRQQLRDAFIAEKIKHFPAILFKPVTSGPKGRRDHPLELNGDVAWPLRSAIKKE